MTHVPYVDDDGIELVDREGGSVLGGEAIRPLAPILHKRFVSKSEIEGVVTTPKNIGLVNHAFLATTQLSTTE